MADQNVQDAVDKLYEIVRNAAKIYVEECNKLQRATVDIVTNHYGVPRFIIERVWEQALQDLVIENISDIFSNTPTNFNEQAGVDPL